jgi:hypothetical protein
VALFIWKMCSFIKKKIVFLQGFVENLINSKFFSKLEYGLEGWKHWTLITLQISLSLSLEYSLILKLKLMMKEKGLKDCVMCVYRV